MNTLHEQYDYYLTEVKNILAGYKHGDLKSEVGVADNSKCGGPLNNFDTLCLYLKTWLSVDEESKLLSKLFSREITPRQIRYSRTKNKDRVYIDMFEYTFGFWLGLLCEIGLRKNRIEYDSIANNYLDHVLNLPTYKIRFMYETFKNLSGVFGPIGDDDDTTWQCEELLKLMENKMYVKGISLYGKSEDNLVDDAWSNLIDMPWDKEEQ